MLSDSTRRPHFTLLQRIGFAAVTGGVTGGLPLLAARRLSAGGPVATTALLFAVLGVLLASAAGSRHAGRRALSAVSFTAAALLVVLHVVVVPFGAYIAWFELAAVGRAQGAVSYVFVLLTGLGAAVAVALAAKPRDPRLRPATDRALGTTVGGAAFLAWALFLGGVIHSSPLRLAAAALIAGAVVATEAAFRARTAGAARRHQRRASGRALGVVAVAAILAVPLAGDRTPQASRLVDAHISPRLRYAVLEIWPQMPLVAEVPGYGEALDSRQLSGRPLLSAAPVYRVRDRTATVSSVSHIRSAVYDRYDGRTWRRAELPDAPESNGTVDAVAVYATAADARAAPPIDTPPSPPDVELEVMADFLTWIPHTLDTTHLRIDRHPTRDAEAARTGTFRGGLSSGLKPNAPLLAGETVHLWTELPIQLPEQLRAEDQQDRMRSRYLQLPDDLPSSVKELADELRRDQPQETVAAIRSELTTKGTYSLDPPRVAPDQDLVAQFLEGGRIGYCVQFATAATVLARAAGIPARYVTGHLVPSAPPSEENQSRVVTGLTAHAWTEVFVDGRWSVLEATPVIDAALSREERRLPTAARLQISDDSLTRRNLEALGFTPPRRAGSLQRARDIVSESAPAFTLAVLAAALTIGAASLLRRALAPPKERIRRLLATAAASAPAEAHPRRVGWSGWEQATEAQLSASPTRDRSRVRRAHLARVRKIAHRLAFRPADAGQPPEQLSAGVSRRPSTAPRHGSRSRSGAVACQARELDRRFLQAFVRRLTMRG